MTYQHIQKADLPELRLIFSEERFAEREVKKEEFEQN